MGTLTNTIVRELKPRQGTYEVTCAGLPGFAVRVLPTGKKVFVVRQRVDGKDSRQKIGPWSPTLSVEDARRKAALILSGVDLEQLEPEPTSQPVAPAREPKAAPRRARPAPTPAVSEHLQRPALLLTVQQLSERFLGEYVDVYLKPNSAKNYRFILDTIILPALGSRDFRTVSRRDVQALHVSLRQRPSQADYMLCVLGSLYTRITQDWELSDMRNPTARVKRFGSRRVERFLSPEERRTVYEVIQVGLRKKPGSRGHLEPAGVWALQLLAFTGLRRSEILTLTWPMIDWQHSVLHLPDTKTGQRAVVVSAQVMTLLREIHDRTGNPRSGLVIRSRNGRPLRSLNKTWETIRLNAGIPDVRLHDLRHSFASDALMSGVPLAVVGEMLGHKQPSTTQRYAHLSDRVVREALEHTTRRIAEATFTIPAALAEAPFEPLTDAQWARIATLTQPPRNHGGRPIDMRKVVDGIRWVLQRKAAWRDIPPAYANYTSCWRWYSRWQADGTWSRVETLLSP